VEFAGVRQGQRVLDVGCGPGALTATLVELIGARAVAAVDPSESFVAAVRARYPSVDVRMASAEALPYPDRAFGAALAQLVVHFMADPAAGAAEMARVVRPGGVVGACVWDFAGGRGPLGPFWEAAREIDPGVVDESHLAARRGNPAALLEWPAPASRRRPWRPRASMRASTTGGGRSSMAWVPAERMSPAWTLSGRWHCVIDAARCSVAGRSASRRTREPRGDRMGATPARVPTRWLLRGQPGDQYAVSG
jgi:SAM-dependent methyltransferase